MNIFATINPQNEPVELFGSFTTYWERGEDGSYELSEIHHSPTALQAYDSDDLDRYRIRYVVVAEPTDGHIRTGYTLAWDESSDAISATATIVEISLDTLKAARQAELATLNDTKSATPFTWDFGSLGGVSDDGSTVTNVGVQTLQIRGLVDQSNWTAANQSAILAVFGGAPTTVIPLKTSDNIWVQVPASTVLQVLATGDGVHPSLFQRQIALLTRFGQLKKAIDNAADATALAAIDLTAGWIV